MKKVSFSIACLLALFVFSASGALALDVISPPAAYDMAINDPEAYIVDVRTAGEWQWVGHPGKNRLGEGTGLEGKVVNIAYMIEKKKQMVLNPSFLAEVNELFGENPNVILILMCRSGNRSLNAGAILEDAGYQVLDLAEGFQGGSDAQGYRTLNGWVNRGLPYSYSGAGYAD